MAHLGIVVPVHNECALLPDLYARLVATVQGPLGAHHCVLVFVDDGSTDGSRAARWRARPVRNAGRDGQEARAVGHRHLSPLH